MLGSKDSAVEVTARTQRTPPLPPVSLPSSAPPFDPHPRSGRCRHRSHRIALTQAAAATEAIKSQHTCVGSHTTSSKLISRRSCLDGHLHFCCGGRRRRAEEVDADAARARGWGRKGSEWIAAGCWMGRRPREGEKDRGIMVFCSDLWALNVSDMEKDEVVPNAFRDLRFTVELRRSTTLIFACTAP
jgi:hypothetical protein